MTTNRAEATIVVQARDRATGQFRKLAGESQRLGGSWRVLTGIVRQLNVGMLALSLTLPAIGAAIGGLVTAQTATSFLTFERAARRARTQLQLMGFSANDARDQVNALTNLMDRANATTILQSAEAMTDVALAGSEMTEQLAPLAETFAELTGLDPGSVLSSFFDAFLKRDPDKLLRLVTGTEDLAIPIEIFDQLEAGFAKPLLDFLTQVTDDTTITNVERLADSFERLAMLTLPSREQFVEFTAGFTNIFIESLAEHLENSKENLNIVLLTSLGAVVATSSKSLGRRAGVGFIAGFTALLLLDFGNTVDTAVKDPETLTTIAAASALAGQLSGKLWIAGFVSLIGLELAPGISGTLDNMEDDEKLGLAAFGVGTAIGLKTKQGLLTSLALGFTLKTAADDLFSGESLRDESMSLAYGGLGAAIGFKIKGPWGAIFGFELGKIAQDLLVDAGLEQHMNTLGLAIGGFMVAGLPGLLIGALIGSAIDLVVHPELRDAWVIVGKAMGGFLMDGIIGVFVEIPIILANLIIAGINKALSGLKFGFPYGGTIDPFPDIPEIPLPRFIPDTGTAQTASTITPGIAAGTLSQVQAALASGVPVSSELLAAAGIQSLAGGGVVQGATGQPRVAVVHGGEMVSSGPMVIQLILDKKIIGQVAIDSIHRTGKFRAGLVPGSVGS